MSLYSIAPNASGSVTFNSSTGAWVYHHCLGYSGTIFLVCRYNVNTEDTNNGDNEFLDHEVSLTISHKWNLEIEQDPASIGDPYVWPIKSNVPVKLPNGKAVYRMFEQGNTYINALVDEATEEHQKRNEIM